MRAPAVTGHETAAVVSPAARAHSQIGAARRSLASSYHRPRVPAEVGIVLESTPWRAGLTPVTIVAWLGKVTVGNTPSAARDGRPALRGARSSGAAQVSPR